MDVKAYAERKSEANAPHMQKGKHRLEKKLKGKISRKNRKVCQNSTLQILRTSCKTSPKRKISKGRTLLGGERNERARLA